jgi:hypothetical protein
MKNGIFYVFFILYPEWKENDTRRTKWPNEKIKKQEKWGELGVWEKKK